MTLYDVQELKEGLLDRALANAEGARWDRPQDGQAVIHGRHVLVGPQPPATRQYQWSPTTDWAIAGPLIMREWNAIVAQLRQWFGEDWPERARFLSDKQTWFLRAYVAYKFGKSIEL